MLPSLLLALAPELVLLVDASDRVCARRMRRRARASSHAPLSDSQLASLLSAYRSSDERVARALGKARPGRLCVIDDHVPNEEAAARLAEGLLHAVKAPRWHGAFDALAEPPLLVVGSSAPPATNPTAAAATNAASTVAAATTVAEAMGAQWGCAAFHAGLAGDDVAADELATTMARQMSEEGRKRRCVLSATPASLPVAIRALQRLEREWTAAVAAAPATVAAAAPATATAAPATAAGSSPPPRPMCVAFVLTSGGAGAHQASLATAESELVRARSVLTSVDLAWEALPVNGEGDGGSGWVDAAVTRAAELVVAKALQLPPLQPLARNGVVGVVVGGGGVVGGSVAGHRHGTAPGASGSMVSGRPLGGSGSGGRNASGKCTASPLSLQLPPSLPPAGLNPTYLAGSALRGLVVVSGTEEPSALPLFPATASSEGGGGGGGSGAGSSSNGVEERPSLCGQLAERLGAAHVALPSLLRSQLAALQKTGSQLPAEQSPLTDTLRAGKLISANSTLRAVQTALHASPEGLVLVEHSAIDSPLEALCACIRPSLVLLVSPARGEVPGSPGSPAAATGGGGWASARHDVHLRLEYERRSLETALGDDAPQVRLAGGECDECCELIFDFLCSEAARDDVVNEADDVEEQEEYEELVVLTKSLESAGINT